MRQEGEKQGDIAEMSNFDVHSLAARSDGEREMKVAHRSFSTREISIQSIRCERVLSALRASLGMGLAKVTNK